MKTLLRYLIPYRGRMAVGLAIKMTATLAELMLPYILSHILKEVVVTQDIRQILLWGGAMILFAAVACICNVIANRMAARVSAEFARKMRSDLFDSTLRLSAAQADRFTIPSLESRITSDTYNAHSFINMMQRMGVRAPILLIGGMAITLLMDAYLALAMLAVLPLIFVTVYFISRNGVPLYSRVQQAVDRMIRVVREDIQGIRVIKALSKTDYEHRRYDAVNRELVSKETRAGVIMGTVNPIMTLLMNGGIVAVVALAAGRVSRGESDPETVIAFMQYFTLISMAMMSVTRMFVMYTKCAASARRIAQVLETEEDLKVLADSDCTPDESGAHIRFDRVSFSYTGKRRELEDITFTLPHGGRLGIIGATGSGKTTLVKLLLRFYDATEGAVYIGGRDIRTIDKETLYATFGTAMQLDFLYDDTIEENIRFGRDIPHEDVVRAAQIAQADGFITAFADGYDHRIAAGGTNISGGQKQRLLIARALAGNPAILILDDSSSALDYKTDAALRKALAEHRANTTVVTVAQRVSTVKDCDRILVLEEGRVIGDGTHDELLEHCPTYREISDSQMGGAFVD